MNRVRRFAGLCARIALLGGTAVLLVATSYSPPECDWTPAVAFRASGSCGPGGLIVVDRDPNTGRIVIHNREALGFGPVSITTGASQSCVSDYAAGGWFVDVAVCANMPRDAQADLQPTDGGVPPIPTDAGNSDATTDSVPTDAAADAGVIPADVGVPVPTSMCTAVTCQTVASDAGDLLLNCSDNVAQRCQSRLTVVK